MQCQFQKTISILNFNIKEIINFVFLAKFYFFLLSLILPLIFDIEIAFLICKFALSQKNTMNTNITDKKYKKLSIQVSLTGLSFCCFDTLHNRIVSINEIQFDTFHKSTKIEELFSDAFKNYPELNDQLR